MESEILASKLSRLETTIHSLQKVLVAFSGGADSAFLLYMAKKVLDPSQILAVVADSATFPAKERDDALAFLSTFGVPYQVHFVDELGNPDFVKNDNKRCYFCRQGLFSALREIGTRLGFEHILEGSNLDDEGDYRPGKVAIKELGIKSPLKDSGLTKAEIRAASEQAGLVTWDRPSMACLSSRVPYGNPITEAKIKRIYAAETYLRGLGVNQVRVRDHDNIARIEVPKQAFEKLTQNGFNTAVFKDLGYTYVVLDLDGYRTGSMNEVLKG